MNYYDMQWLQLTTSLSVTLDMIAYYVQSPARLTASDTTCTTTCAQPPITRLLLKHHSAFSVYKHENQLGDMTKLCLARIYESRRWRRTRVFVHSAPMPGVDTTQRFITTQAFTPMSRSTSTSPSPPHTHVRSTTHRHAATTNSSSFPHLPKQPLFILPSSLPESPHHRSQKPRGYVVSQPTWRDRDTRAIDPGAKSPSAAHGAKGMDDPDKERSQS